MARAERWEIASDAELVKRGRILTILGVIILCLGSLVTVALMSVTDSSGPQRTSSGPIRLVAPQVASQGSTGGAGAGSTGGAATTGESSGGATTGGASGAELPTGGTTGAGTAMGVTGPSNLDPNLVPAPGTNILGLPVLGATPSPAPTPPSSTGQVFDL